jgi:hypothetical protein
MAKEFWQQVKAAIIEGNPDEVARLISDDDSNLRMSTVFGSWLHMAAKYGQLGVAKRLVEMGVDVNARGGVSNGTALNVAASKGHVPIVEYCLTCGAEFDTSEPERNPLIGAVYGGHKTVVETLLRHGLDPNVTHILDNGTRRNALSYARRRGQNEIAELLLAAGCATPAATLAVTNQETNRTLLSMMEERYGEVSEITMPEIFPIDDESYIRLYAIRPSDRHHCWTLFTVGMSAVPMTVPDGQEVYRFAELLIHLPASWPMPFGTESSKEPGWPVSWLHQIAYYPYQENTWLGGRWTIISNDEPPEPFASNTGLSCMLLIADFAGWSPIIVDNKQIHVYTLVPIYAEERDLETQFGVPELLRRFDQAGVTTIVDSSRMNVAQIR